MKVKQLTIEKTESNGLLETFIETEQEKYEAKNGIVIILVRGKRQSGEPEIASPATGNHF